MHSNRFSIEQYGNGKRIACSYKLFSKGLTTCKNERFSFKNASTYVFLHMGILNTQFF